MTNLKDAFVLTEKMKCELCESEFNPSELTETNDGLICSKCLNDYYEECYECGEWYHLDNMSCVGNHHHVCEDCLYNNYFFCEDCEEYHKDSELIKIYYNSYDLSEWKCVCEECANDNYYRCNDCGEWYESSCITTICNGNHICDNCLEDYSLCDECNEWYPNDYVMHINNGYYCKDCVDYESIIYGYHDYEGPYTPIGNDGSYHFGIELELESDDDNAKLVNKLEYLHCERDGSLNDGFEIISQPLSLKTWLKNKEFKELTSELIKNGARSHDTSTCGLHIHISKKACNSVERIRAITELFYTEITKLARRKNNHYCRYLSERYEDCGIETIKKECKKDRYDRYLAVNTSNHSTIEFRLFRGTLNHSTILASIELVNNIVELANTTQTIIHFSDLIKGKYLPAYAKKRKVNLNKTIDITDFINAYALKGGK